MRARTSCRVRTCALQGGLSRNKVAVGESAAGSPPKQKKTHQPDADKPNKILKPEVLCGSLVSLGLVDQLEDRCLCKAEALGSSPSKSIFVHPESKFSGKDGLPALTGRCMKSCIGAVYWTLTGSG